MLHETILKRKYHFGQIVVGMTVEHIDSAMLSDLCIAYSWVKLKVFEHAHMQISGVLRTGSSSQELRKLVFVHRCPRPSAINIKLGHNVLGSGLNALNKYKPRPPN